MEVVVVQQFIGLWRYQNNRPRQKQRVYIDYNRLNIYDRSRERLVLVWK